MKKTQLQIWNYSSNLLNSVEFWRIPLQRDGFLQYVFFFSPFDLTGKRGLESHLYTFFALI